MDVHTYRLNYECFIVMNVINVLLYCLVVKGPTVRKGGHLFRKLDPKTAKLQTFSGSIKAPMTGQVMHAMSTHVARKHRTGSTLPSLPQLALKPA